MEKEGGEYGVEGMQSNPLIKLKAKKGEQGTT